MESARLTRNIFWKMVFFSAPSTKTSLPALPALLTALMHRKLLADLFGSSFPGITEKR